MSPASDLDRLQLGGGAHARRVFVFAASDSAAAGDGDTITLNAGALQTFEILPVSLMTQEVKLSQTSDGSENIKFHCSQHSIYQ